MVKQSNLVKANNQGHFANRSLKPLNILQLQKLSLFDKSKKSWIFRDVNLDLGRQEVIYLIGPNGVGKSMLLKSIMGVITNLDTQRNFELTGKIIFGKHDITDLTAQERAQKGIYMTWQNPPAIPELTVKDLLHAIWQNQLAKKNETNDFVQSDSDVREYKLFLKLLKKVSLPKSFLDKPLNTDMSGGQIKRVELLSMLLLKPKLLLLDELDSGLDVESEKLLFGLVSDFIQENKASAIVVSHNFRVRKYLKPDKVFILWEGTLFGPFVPDIIEQIESSDIKSVIIHHDKKEDRALSNGNA